MAATNADVIINGVKARLLQAEGGGYKRRTIRQEIQQQVLTQSENPVYRNRADGVGLYQTSWAGGSRWWKPLITPSDLASYFQGNNMDTWSEPGKVVPGNRLQRVANSSLQDPVVSTFGQGSLYAVGSTKTTDGTNFDVYEWNGGTPNFERVTSPAGVTTGSTHKIVSMVYDPTDSYFYVVGDTSHLERWKIDGTKSANWITTGFSQYPGCTLFLQAQSLMLYSGDKIYTVSKSVPSVTSVFDDGMGPDALFDYTVGGPVGDPEYLNLAVSTPEGIYYVKNTMQGASPVPWVFRVDKDASGAWTGSPIATLPAGTIAFDIAYHLGQVIIATTPQWFEWEFTDAEIVLYFVGEGGMGALGSILGSRDEVDETPWSIVGSDGPFLYISGQKRMWVYDAVRGGLHSAFEYPTDLGDGAVRQLLRYTDTSGSTLYKRIFMGDGAFFHQATGQHDDPDTVTNFGDDETHYVLTSNYFDGGLPMETKEITKVAIDRDAGNGSQEWTLQISADDGAFADVLTHSTTGETYAEAAVTSVSGRRFQYRLIYQTKTAVRTALRAVFVEMATGEMITEWHLLLDGAELINLDGVRQDPKDFADSMVTLGDTQTIITLVDNYQDHQRTTPTSTTVNVKVAGVEIVKDTPGESVVQVVLREA